MTEALMTTYYTVAVFFADKRDRLKERGTESGLTATTELAFWILGVLVVAGGAYAIYKTWIQKQTDNVNNFNSPS